MRCGLPGCRYHHDAQTPDAHQTHRERQRTYAGSTAQMVFRIWRQVPTARLTRRVRSRKAESMTIHGRGDSFPHSGLRFTDSCRSRSSNLCERRQNRPAALSVRAATRNGYLACSLCICPNRRAQQHANPRFPDARNFAESLQQKASAGRVKDVRTVVQRIQKLCVVAQNSCTSLSESVPIHVQANGAILGSWRQIKNQRWNFLNTM